MKILLTGCAGFIGMHVTRKLLDLGNTVTGVDNLNEYYDPRLKHGRLSELSALSNFNFIESDITDLKALERIFEENPPNRVINLAAQPGVRYSIENPHVYIQSNIVGFQNILECCRHNNIEHLVYASSSSVYGSNAKVPFAVTDNVDHPVSLYAATKKANELMAHTYSHLYGLPTTGLRYFTVYGPWGRPDMSAWLFTSSILKEEPIKVFNHGKMKRDFTYVEDVANITARILDHIPNKTENLPVDEKGHKCSNTPYKVYNVGNNTPIELMTFIETIENALGKKAEKVFLDIQPGDVLDTFADVEDLRRDVGIVPNTSLSYGISEWVNWFKSYNNS